MKQMDFVDEGGNNTPQRKPRPRATTTATPPSAPRATGPRPGCKRLTADIPADLHKRLKMQALQEDSTVTDIVIQATKAWLANRRKG